MFRFACLLAALLLFATPRPALAADGAATKAPKAKTAATKRPTAKKPAAKPATAPAANAAAVALFAPLVSGTITDPQGQPLPGATI
jgi:protocatechuate 3,4-dioxygenase beta subunit